MDTDSFSSTITPRRHPTTPASRRTLLGALVAGALVTLAAEGTADTQAIARPRGHRRRHGRAQVIVPSGDPTTCNPAATSGITGLVLIGPMCPVVTIDDPCPDRPFAAQLAIQDALGQTICTVSSGEDGRFRAGLAPGEYLLVPITGVGQLPYALPQTVTVWPNQFTEVTVSYDSGIR